MTAQEVKANGCQAGREQLPEEQLRVYRRLLELAQRKGQLLLRGPVGSKEAEQLEVILRQENALLEAAEQLERKGEAAGRVAAGPAAQELRRVLQELKGVNLANGELLRHWQRYVDFNLGILEKGMENGIYRGDAAGPGGVKKVVTPRPRISREV